MTAGDRQSALLLAALELVGDGATESELAARFASAGAQLADDTATRLLADLTRLGLVRTTDGRHFVPTSVGRRRLQEGAALGTDEAGRLAELERLRTDLLSTIAHELRTPLTALRTSVSLLRDTQQLPDEQQSQTLLATIDRNAARMQRLIEDILELARFRSGNVSLQLRRFDARQLAKAGLALVEPLAAASDQQVRLDVPPRPVFFFGDHRRLEQAVVNLLSNAHRYSPPGARIVLSVSEANDEVAWTVRDTGPGIEPADQARLFERFFVGRNDRSGGTGVGLGLPTTLAIAQAHGGRVDVDSRPGAGSTFTIVVPRGGPEREADT